MTRQLTTILAGLLLALIGSTARAEGTENLIHPWGMSVSAGGGVNDFTGDELRDITGTGGTWDARFMFGTRQHVGFEAAYLGTAQAIDAIGMEENAVLLSNGVEADVRLNALTGSIQPYVFAGAAWKRYDLTNTDTNTSSVNDSDDVLEVPVGCGIGYTYKGLIFDARASYRFAADEDLVPAPDGDGESTLDNVNLSGHVGVEF